MARDVAMCCLLLIAAPLAVLLAVLDAIFPAKQGVLTCGFERRA